ncbi:hypothetical protein G9464_15255 [Halostella sp. JP-L12]|uniref:hypothetical protein n=1 Tax=Halostella TaxID=1843185 RepID=UPI000EF760C7|nr:MULTISPECIES: hypothetical protein [Halostella]NHN48942.1 hypothetical protein [Halostella sp. JP-L12]
MRNLARVCRAGTILSGAALCLVVATVGAVAFVAELHATWTWYFRMERAIETATPVAMWLLATSVAFLFGTVATAEHS